MVGMVGGAFHSNTNCESGVTLCTLQPSLPRVPSGRFTPNHSSNAPPGVGSTLAAFGAKKLSMPSVVVHAFQTSATGASTILVTAISGTSDCASVIIGALAMRATNGYFHHDDIAS